MILKSKNYFQIFFETNHVLHLLIWLLFFVLPLTNKFSNILIAVLLTLSIVKFIREKKYAIKVFWFLPTLFTYYSASELLSGGEVASLEKRLLFLLVPVLFALNVNLFNGQFRRQIYFGVVLGNIFAILVCLIRAIWRSFKLQDGDWIFNAKVIQQSDFDFLTSAVMGGNYFFSDQFSYFVHPTYFGIQIVLAQYLVFEILKSEQSKKVKRILLIFFVVFLCVVFLLSSKAIIISSVVLTLCLLLRLQTSSWVLKITSITFVSVVSVLFVSLNPRLKVFRDSFNLNSFNHPDPKARFGHDLRILSWNASLDLIKSNWLIGVGEANKTTELVKAYTRKGYDVPAQQMHNSHNQYLDFFIGGGVIAFSLFMVGLVSLFVNAINRRNYLMLAFLLIFSFNAIFENLLSRYAGILFFSVFASFLHNKDEQGS